ncbi:hypothetical protein ASZ78_001335 [Callipepla squamata]|uniref:SET domain-containing protein n=1 Tax=Callipepla squamata TaxID=9009 RepID=A0A226N434_CALSU|nr:hypothetical protein ASZ78_001335 [Callipepla squamata]
MHASRAPAISVSAESCIPAGLRLGPVPGIFKLGKYLSDRREPGLKKKVRMVRGELVDEAGSSALEWIGLIRAARNAQEQTLEAVADLPGGQIFYRALRDVQPGEELTVWYSNPLAQWFDIPLTATPTHDEKEEQERALDMSAYAGECGLPVMPLTYPEAQLSELAAEKGRGRLEALPAGAAGAAGGKAKAGHLCLYCGKLYSRNNLNKHIRLHAEGNTPYRCEYCGKVLGLGKAAEERSDSGYAPAERDQKTDNESDQ